MKAQDYDAWSADFYDIFQMAWCVPGQYHAVWAVPDDEDQPEGGHHLEAEPIEVMAVAKCTTKHYRRLKGDKGAGTVVDEYSVNTVVVLELISGYWDVSNDNKNFAGIMKTGQKISDCCGDLHVDYHKLIPELK